jgi:hypothetical protein
MDNVLHYVLGVLFLAILGAAGILINHLGRQTVPQALVPVANAWTRAGKDPKWIRFFMWILFSLFAAAFFGVLLYGMYDAALHLGKRW